MKYFGAIVVILAGGGIGMLMAGAYRREEHMLEQLLDTLVWMQCALSCRASELSEIFFQVSARNRGSLGVLFYKMGTILAARVAPDAACCMQQALSGIILPDNIRTVLEQLGKSLGEFHLDAQLKQLAVVESECRILLQTYRENRPGRVRICQTIGFSGGIFLAILLM